MLQFYTEQFELKFKELINDLFNKYPDKLEIIVYKRTLDKLDYGKVSENFCTSLNEYSDLIVVLTGGDTNFLYKQFKISIFAFPNFIFEGLNFLLEHNSKK